MEYISDFFYNLAYTFVSWLPEMVFSIPHEFKYAFYDFISGACYFLPIKLLMPILFFWLTFQTVRITWKVILRIKSFIPMMGD